MGALREQISGEVTRLRRYAYSLTRNPDTADDLAQASFERAIAREHLWQKGTDLRAWLCTIVLHQYIDHLRYAALRKHAEYDDTELSLSRSGDQDAGLLVRDLRRALSQLPERQRAAILLVGLEGQSYKTAARTLNCPIGTIRSRFSRGREALDHLMNGLPAPVSSSASRLRQSRSSKACDGSCP